jgi:hypothetical protein
LCHGRESASPRHSDCKWLFLNAMNGGPVL